MFGKDWDLKSTHSLEAAAEYFRKKSDALIVIVIRPHDGTLAADLLIDGIDVEDRLNQDIHKLTNSLQEIRDIERARQLKREKKQYGT
jgi:hypothetical protein